MASMSETSAGFACLDDAANSDEDVSDGSSSKVKTDNIIFMGDSNQLKQDDLVDAINNLVVDLDNVDKQYENGNIVDKLEKLELNLDNYEKFFNLDKFRAFNIATSFEDKTHSMVYKDAADNSMAIVKIDFRNNKLILEFLGSFLPKQKFLRPNDVFDKVHTIACMENWIKEDGGFNQFNGNFEFRYKDRKGNVMAAIIYNDCGNVENIVRYEYKNGKRYKMINTSIFREMTTIYDVSREISHSMTVETDTDGNLIRVVKDFGC